MEFNPEKMNTLIKKASFNYLLNAVQLSFTPDKVTSRMASPYKDFAVLIDTQSNDVLRNGDETVKFNLYLNGRKSQKILDEEREAGFEIREMPKRGRAETKTYYNRVFKSYNGIDNERNVEIKDTDWKLIHRFEFDLVDKEGKSIGTQSLPLVDDNHESILGITIGGEKEQPEPFFSCDINEEILKKLKPFPKNSIHRGKHYFLVKDDRILLEQVKFGENGVSAVVPWTISKMENKFGHEFGIEFNYRNFLHVLDVLKDKEYELQLLFAYPEERTKAAILVKSKDGEEKYYIFATEIVKADYDKRFMAENDEDFLPKIETESEMPEKWSYTGSVDKTKEILSRWKDLSNDMLTELRTAKKILKKTPSERAQIMHGTYVGWMTWTQYCIDIGHSTQVVNRWLKRAFGDEQSNEAGDESANENPPEISESTDGEPKLPDNYLSTMKNVLGDEFSESITDKSKRIFLDLQHQTRNEREENITNLMRKIRHKKVDEAIVLANSNGTCSEYFQQLFNGVMCFTNHRIKFEGNGNNAHGSCFVYFGENEKKFVEEFSKYGVVMKKVE